MKLSILMFALIILINSNEILHADKKRVIVDAMPFHIWRLDMLHKYMAQLRKKILDLKMSLEDWKNDKQEEIRRGIFEKFLLPHANGTSVLKDFYAGRYK